MSIVQQIKIRLEPIIEIIKPLNIKLSNDPIELTPIIHEISSLFNGPDASGVSIDSNFGRN